MKKILLCLMLLGYITIAQAQTRVAIIGGVHSASVKGEDDPDDDIDESRTGFHGGLLLDIPFTSMFSFQPSAMYTQKGRKIETTGLEQWQNVNYLDVPMNLVLKFGGDKTKFIVGAGPYIGLLLGGKEKTITTVGGVSTTTENTDLERGDGPGQYNSFQWGWNALAGVEFGRVFLTANYSRGLNDFYESDTHDGSLRHQTIGGTLGIFLNRGTPKVRDRDNDGVVDADDECPDEAGSAVTRGCPDRDADGIADRNDNCPDVAGTTKYNGCPVPDSDNDGINDENDKCPNQAGTAKYNGCPVPDSDNDGINDENDKCPNQAGTAKYEGCPVPDTDRDGINDEEDLCPTVAGARDNMGCPEINSKLAERVTVSARTITFGSNNATLTAGAKKSLDEVASILEQNPELKLTIETHTATGGDEQKMMQLSNDRAAAVESYLVSKGIADDRITTTGYGSSQPINSGTTASERAKNARVVLKLSNH